MACGNSLGMGDMLEICEAFPLVLLQYCGFDKADIKSASIARKISWLILLCCCLVVVAMMVILEKPIFFVNVITAIGTFSLLVRISFWITYDVTQCISSFMK